MRMRYSCTARWIHGVETSRGDEAALASSAPVEVMRSSVAAALFLMKSGSGLAAGADVVLLVVAAVIIAVRNLVGLAMAMMMTHNAPSSRMRRPDERTVSLAPFFRLVLWRVAGETGPQRASPITWTRGVEWMGTGRSPTLRRTQL